MPALCYPYTYGPDLGGLYCLLPAQLSQKAEEEMEGGEGEGDVEQARADVKSCAACESGDASDVPSRRNNNRCTL